MNLVIQPVSDSIFLLGEIEVGLKVEPELRGDAKIASETQGSIRRDAPLPVDDFIDSPGRDADVLCQSVLRDAHGLEELFHENLAGMDGRYLHFSHAHTPSDSPGFLRHRHCRRATESKYAIGRLYGCYVVPICFRSRLPVDSPEAHAMS